MHVQPGGDPEADPGMLDVYFTHRGDEGSSKAEDGVGSNMLPLP